MAELRDMMVSAHLSARREWEALLETGRSHPRVSLAYCTYNVWSLFVLMGPLYAESMPGSRPLSVAIPYLEIATVCLAIALAFKRWRFAYDKQHQRIGACVAMTLGTLFQMALVMDSPVAEPSAVRWLVYVVAYLLIAVGLGFYRIEIDRAFGWLGAQKTLHLVIWGTIATAPLIALIMDLSPLAAYAMALVLPAVSYATLNGEVRRAPARQYFFVDREMELPIPTQFIATSFVQGVAGGVSSALFAVGALEFASNPYSSASSIVAWPVGVVIVFFVTTFLQLDYNRLLYKVGFPMLALQFVLMGILPDIPQVHMLVGSSASVFMDLVLWSLGAFIIKGMGVPVTWIASFPGAALFAGTGVGAAAVHLATYASPASEAAPVIALVTACFLLFSSLSLLSEKNLRNGWGTFRPGTLEGFETNRDAAVSYLAGEFGLSAREAQIAHAVASGMARDQIADELFVSRATVKTHLRNIYRKLDVHSQEELVSLVDQTCRAMGGEEGRDAS